MKLAVAIGMTCKINGRKGALLRATAAMDSEEVGMLKPEDLVTILELTYSHDGTYRAKVGGETATGFASVKLLKPLPPVRVLGLHGGGASAKVMKYQTLKLQRELGPRATWDFLDGTRDWTSMVDPMLSRLFDGGPFHGWYGVDDDGPTDRDYNSKLFDESVKFWYTDVEAGLDFVERHIRESGPYDVICGFSQGTIIATLLTAALLRRGEKPSWRGNVLVCGIPPRDPVWRDTLPKPRLDFPASLVFSPNDHMYEYGQGLVDIYADGTPVLSHDEGHRFPADAAKTAEIAAEVLRVGRAPHTAIPGADLAGAG